jgi:hypothetical protein
MLEELRGALMALISRSKLAGMIAAGAPQGGVVGLAGHTAGLRLPKVDRDGFETALKSRLDDVDF